MPVKLATQKQAVEQKPQTALDIIKSYSGRYADFLKSPTFRSTSAQALVDFANSLAQNKPTGQMVDGIFVPDTGLGSQISDMPSVTQAREQQEFSNNLAQQLDDAKEARMQDIAYRNQDLELKRKALENKNDDGQDIKATYLTSWDSLGTTNRKKNNFVTLDLFQEGGSSTVYCQVASDYKVNNLNKASLPKQLNFLKTWEDIRANWQDNARTAWFGESLNQYFNIKFSRGTLGRTLACKVEVLASEVSAFKLGNLSLDLVVTNS